MVTIRPVLFRSGFYLANGRHSGQPPLLWWGLPTPPPSPTEGLPIGLVETFGRDRWPGRETGPQRVAANGRHSGQPRQVAHHSKPYNDPQVFIPRQRIDVMRTTWTFHSAGQLVFGRD